MFRCLPHFQLHSNRAPVLMASRVVQMCFDGSWENLENGCMEYKNGKNTAFFLRKDSTFHEFIATVCEVLGIDSTEYGIQVRTVLKSNCPTQPATSLPIDILDDETVRIVQCLNSDPLKYGFTPIFVTIPDEIGQPVRMPRCERSRKCMAPCETAAAAVIEPPVRMAPCERSRRCMALGYTPEML